MALARRAFDQTMSISPKKTGSTAVKAALRPPLRIGDSLEIFPPVLQAPMSGLTNRATRTLAEDYGCGLAVNEWVPAASLAAGNAATLGKLARASERPFAIQLFGREPRAMERAAALAVAGGADLVDLNMGCPGKKVRSGSTGAALMREPALARELVHAARIGCAGRAPVSVKMRAGWDDTTKNAPELAALLCDAGAAMITVHGRTRQQRYSGPVDLEIIAEVKTAVTVPVIANGDIVDLATMHEALRTTSADGVMIGRAALGNPWIFAELATAFVPGPLPAPPTASERIRILRRHLLLHLDRGASPALARASLIEMRKFAKWYLEGLPDEAALCRQLNRAEELERFEELLEDYGATLSAAGAADQCFPLRPFGQRCKAQARIAQRCEWAPA